ncbi:Rieske (2Fe-2S) protein [Novosphingobium sp. M1R2S20]|uniref:Rieske (2Fe-2S) protein n=1 Tax=Novosphingobium rhizovicinum TaxID=3228928 RepID=A0ABV3RDX4_9SPHN
MEFVKVANTSQVAESVLLPVEAKGRKLLLIKVDGTYYAAQRRCPHMGFNLCRGAVVGHSVVCPLHKASFDLETGAVNRDPRLLFINMKAKADLETYPVRVDAGEIFVGI